MESGLAWSARDAAAKLESDRDRRRANQRTCPFKPGLLGDQAGEDDQSGRRVSNRLPSFARRRSQIRRRRHPAHQREHKASDPKHEAQEHALLHGKPPESFRPSRRPRKLRAATSIAPITPCSAAIGTSTKAAGGLRPAALPINRRTANWPRI